jgi:hypothetical protein
MEDPEYLVNPPVTSRQLNDLCAASWDGHEWSDFEMVLGRSLGYVCAYLGGELIGFVNLAWDGGATRSSWTPPCIPTSAGGASGADW